MKEAYKKSLFIAKGLVIAIVILLVGAMMVTAATNDDVKEPDAIQAEQTVPMISNSNVVNINTEPFTIHDLTDEEWEGIKGLRGRDDARVYIRNNPGCTLTEVVNNVDGFGVKSAEKIENYIIGKVK